MFSKKGTYPAPKKRKKEDMRCPIHGCRLWVCANQHAAKGHKGRKITNEEVEKLGK